jgi:ketopantoate hydroxymethyltransferase
MLEAVQAYRQDVEARSFPAPEHSIEMADEEWETFLKS